MTSPIVSDMPTRELWLVNQRIMLFNVLNIEITKTMFVNKVGSFL